MRGDSRFRFQNANYRQAFLEEGAVTCQCFFTEDSGAWTVNWITHMVSLGFAGRLVDRLAFNFQALVMGSLGRFKILFPKASVSPSRSVF